MRLIQLQNEKDERRVALVEAQQLRLLNEEYPTIYDLASTAINGNKSLSGMVKTALTPTILDYEKIYRDENFWKILPSIDHPHSQSECYVSGTGLTHKASAANRQKMHGVADQDLTDSMKMYLWGEHGGKPTEGNIGVQPEWFYKGNGSILRGHGQELQVPEYGDDGGEEPEIAGIYIIGENGDPYRIGFTTGNEFSDHVMEKKNYLYLAPSKLRQCAIGPELVITDDFSAISGTVKILRNREILWSASIASGEANMAHSLANLEHHHFKYEQHRLPGQLHVHFFGAADFSFGHDVSLRDGDIMEVKWDNCGKALQNQIKILRPEKSMVTIRSL